MGSKKQTQKLAKKEQENTDTRARSGQVIRTGRQALPPALRRGYYYLDCSFMTAS